MGTSDLGDGIEFKLGCSIRFGSDGRLSAMLNGQEVSNCTYTTADIFSLRVEAGEFIIDKTSFLEDDPTDSDEDSALEKSDDEKEENIETSPDEQLAWPPAEAAKTTYYGIISFKGCRGGVKVHAVGTAPIPEITARRLFRDLVVALHHLHAQRIFHCDIKPNNLMMTGSVSDARLKLIDFGQACFSCEDDQTYGNEFGTLGFRAPEHVGLGPQDALVMPCAATDMWSAGCVLFCMMLRRCPFEDCLQGDCGDEDTLNSVLRLLEQSELWNDVKDMIQRLLVFEPAARLTAAQALEHPWLRDSG